MPKARVRTPSSYKMLLAAATAILAILVSLAPGQHHDAVVVKVYDGDTFQLSTGEKVRLIGIDCPELHESEKLNADAQRSGKDKKVIQAMGASSKEYTERWVLGQKVRLVFDRQKKDKYGRLLAYVYLSFPRPALLNSPRSGYVVKLDGEKWYFLNATIVQAGYAVPMTIPPNDKHAMVIQALYEQAREMQLGLWASNTPLKPAARKKKLNKFVSQNPELVPSF